ncbi:pyridoxamine 5'-phosphate oxidase family protein [Streptomyces sp. NPDC057697]|uniref:pyridoxamine 5'-phosphate oxidase family protein n=1 Tax=Streptomyces sp. NPDC057697 TaxID=3346219 RepID=UPI0036C9C799
MRAHLGDRLVVGGPADGADRRDGEIVGLHHVDGTPPYDVRWSDTGRVTLVFPGPDALLRHPEESPSPVSPAPSGPGTAEGAGIRPDGTPGAGDIGRRVAMERERQGLTRAETARRARMAPDYLAYIEQRPADPSPATLVSLADVLGTTVSALRGSDTGLPPGRGQALTNPRLEDLTPDECRARLSTHGVGRIALSTADGPGVFPVNYEVVDDTIAFRTAPGSGPATATDKDVAFEVDHVDETVGQGWSVLAVGPARTVTEPEEVRRLTAHAHSTPWAGGGRDTWVSIRPTRLTGRRISPGDSGSGPDS